MCLRSKKISGTLNVEKRVVRILGSDVCSTTMHRTECRTAMVKLSIFITLLIATFVRQQYERK